MRETGAMLFQNFFNATNDPGNSRQISTKAG